MTTQRQLDREIAEHLARERLRARIQRLIDKWQPILGVTVHMDLRKMKTYWGSSNDATRHILLNTKVAELPQRYVEYLVVHELVHQLTDGHDQRFYALMDRHLPGWRRMQARIGTPLTRHS